MVGVGVKLTEVLDGMEMALPAGAKPILSRRQWRTWIADRYDVVGAMAVGALGRRLVAQLRQLAVYAHRIAAGKIRMAVATTIRELLAKWG